MSEETNKNTTGTAPADGKPPVKSDEVSVKPHKLSDSTLRLTESAIMIAAAMVLSFVKIFEMPMGGSITLFSQVPIIVIAYRYGPKWGVLTGSVFGLVQMLFGLSYMAGLAKTFSNIAIFVLFDYIIAFGVLGLGGIFRRVIKNQAVSLAVGGAVASLLRLCSHIVSGCTIWGAYASDWNMPVWKYSIFYNAQYMLVETAITAFGCAVIGGSFALAKRDITKR